MINLNDALNNAIAVVVVILILSLVVQSIQSAVKKLFKIKSRQIEESLVDLLRNVFNKPPPKMSWFGKLIDHSPVTRFIFFWRPDKAKMAGVAGIYNHIMCGFADMGRLSQSGKQMLDSIAKEDLVKVMGKVPVAGVLPALVPGVVAAFRNIKDLETDIQNLQAAAQTGAASGQFASMSADYAAIEVALRPLFNDIQSIIEARKVTVPEYPPTVALSADTVAGGSDPNNAASSSADAGAPTLTPALLVGDLMALRTIKIEDVLKMLADFQTKLKAASATLPAGDPAGRDLAALATGLGKLATDITALRKQMDAAVAPIQSKINEVEKWYDMVMQSFEERYNRSMKTWALVIAFLVVAVLNADIFTIYRTVAANGVISKTLEDKGPEIVKLLKDRAATQQSSSAQTQTGQTSAAPAQPVPGTPGTANDAKKELKAEIDQLKQDVGLFIDVGFAPLTLQELKTWVPTLSPWNPKFLATRKSDLRTLLGWIVMTMLLSIGAPFWQDTLESLFGVKNLLRKKGDIKNVETESGAGQPNT